MRWLASNIEEPVRSGMVLPIDGIKPWDRCLCIVCISRQKDRGMIRRTHLPVPLITSVLFAGLLLTTGRSHAQQRMPILAKGVLKTVPATPEESELFTGPRPLHDLADQTKAWKPNYQPENRTLAVLANELTFRRNVGQLEFSFKTMRLIRVNDGRGGTQNVWYLLYKVNNVGARLQTVESTDAFGNPEFSVKPSSGVERFFPIFVLRSHEFDKSYSDQILPGVLQMIHAKEIRDPAVTLHDSVSITRVPLEPSTDATDKGVWGVAMWPAVDRETDFFSVYVQGLSNAYQWEDGKDKQPLLTYKTLQLNFWRPGDSAFESTKEFRFGLPLYPSAAKTEEVRKLYGVTEPTDWNWVYQP